MVSPAFDREEYDLYLPEGQWRNIESKEVYKGGSFVHVETKSFANGGTSLLVFQKEGTSIPLLAQKEVMHVPATAWKREDLDFMTFTTTDITEKIYVPGECGKVEFIQVEAKKNA